MSCIKNWTTDDIKAIAQACIDENGGGGGADTNTTYSFDTDNPNADGTVNLVDSDGNVIGPVCPTCASGAGGDGSTEPGVADASTVDPNGDPIAPGTTVNNYYDAAGNYVSSLCAGGTGGGNSANCRIADRGVVFDEVDPCGAVVDEHCFNPSPVPTLLLGGFGPTIGGPGSAAPTPNGTTGWASNVGNVIVPCAGSRIMFQIESTMTRLSGWGAVNRRPRVSIDGGATFINVDVGGQDSLQWLGNGTIPQTNISTVGEFSATDWYYTPILPAGTYPVMFDHIIAGSLGDVRADSNRSTGYAVVWEMRGI